MAEALGGGVVAVVAQILIVGLQLVHQHHQARKHWCWKLFIVVV